MLASYFRQIVKKLKFTTENKIINNNNTVGPAVCGTAYTLHDSSNNTSSFWVSNSCHGDVTCCHGDVTCCHGDVTCCHGDVTCSHVDVQLFNYQSPATLVHVHSPKPKPWQDNSSFYCSFYCSFIVHSTFERRVKFHRPACITERSVRTSRNLYTFS